jgi:hypothetical protein
MDKDLFNYEHERMHCQMDSNVLTVSSSSDLKVQTSNSQMGMNDLNSNSTVTTDYKNPSLECLVYTPDTQNLIFSDNLKPLYMDQLSYLSN